jgi:OmpA-OmpF porin, OOP family
MIEKRPWITSNVISLHLWIWAVPDWYLFGAGGNAAKPDAGRCVHEAGRGRTLIGGKRALRIFAAVASGLIFLLTAGVLWAAPGKGGAPQTGVYLFLTPTVVFPFDVDTTSPKLSPATTRTRWGVGISGGLGYRYGDFRVEGEIMYDRNDVKDIRFSGGGGNMSGYYDLWGATVNLFYDVPTGVRIRPYVGAGLGGALFTAHDITLAGFPPTQGSNRLFTYKLMAGVSYALRDSWRLLLGYRFMGLNGQDYETGGTPLHGDPIRTHAVQVGVQFHF